MKIEGLTIGESARRERLGAAEMAEGYRDPFDSALFIWSRLAQVTGADGVANPEGGRVGIIRTSQLKL